MDNGKAVTVTVMISTRNRCSDLKRTLGVLAQMNPLPEEILITADGCTDDTVTMVQREYPGCRLQVNSPGLGSVPSRDRMLREAAGELVISLDDDSYPLSTDFFARIPSLFLDHPEAAVITFPELRDSGQFIPLDKDPLTPGHYLAAYANGAAAMRRSSYLQTSGYPSFFVHAYEEPDYAAQCYAQGMAVWFEPSLVIRHHFSSINRNSLRTHHLNARNELWSVWMRCSWPWLLPVSLYRVWRQFCYACTEGWHCVLQEPLWWCSALAGVLKCRRSRRPITWSVYYAWMKLARHPLHRAEELRPHFPQSPPIIQPTHGVRERR